MIKLQRRIDLENPSLETLNELDWYALKVLSDIGEQLKDNFPTARQIRRELKGQWDPFGIRYFLELNGINPKRNCFRWTCLSIWKFEELKEEEPCLIEYSVVPVFVPLPREPLHVDPVLVRKDSQGNYQPLGVLIYGTKLVEISGIGYFNGEEIKS